MNMIRCWGGGYYEEDAFYDACDEMGILVWCEFKFACAVYPGGNPAFVDNVRQEVIDQVNRLGNHPCIAVWCGNNEVTALVSGYKTLKKSEYDHLFHDVIGAPDQVDAARCQLRGRQPRAGGRAQLVGLARGSEFREIPRFARLDDRVWFSIIPLSRDRGCIYRGW